MNDTPVTAPNDASTHASSRASHSAGDKNSNIETRHEGPAWHRRVNGLNVMKVAGSFEAMGRQHGTLLSDQIRRGPLPYYRRFIEKAMGASSLGPLAPAAVYAIQRLVGGRVAATMPPWVHETMRGVAAGAGLPYEQILEGATMPDSFLWLASRLMDVRAVPPAVRHRLALGLGCTSAIAWGSATRDGKLLHARNFDYQGVSCWPSTASVIFHEPTQGQRYVSCGAAGVALGGITAMNEAGLTLTVHQHMFTDRTRLGGVPIGVVGDEVMREARTLDDAEAILRRHRHIGCWTYLIADGRRREVLCHESNPDRQVVRRIGTGEEVFGYANIYLDPELGATELDLYPTYWRHNHGRYVRVNELLSARRGSLDPESMASILADVGTPACRVRDSIAMVLTVGSVVFRPEDGVLWLANGEAPTSHNTFVPFSLAAMDHAPDVAPLEPAKSLDPRARDAFEQYRLAYIAYMDDYDLPAARAAMDRAATLAPDQPVYAAVSGLMALQHGDPAGASVRLDAAIALGHPDEERLASFHLWRGRAADVAGDRSQASRSYRAVLGMHADGPVRRAAEKALRRPFQRSQARRIHVEMSLGDVMTP